MLRPVLVVTAFVVLASSGALTGCTDDAEQPPASATAAWPDDQLAGVREDLAAKFAGDHPEVEDTEAGECFARLFTIATTPDQLDEAGVLVDGEVVEDLPKLPPDVAARWAEAQFGCTDFVAESTSAMQKIAKGRLDEASYRYCLEQELTEDDMRAGVQAALEGRFDATEVTDLSDAQSDCYDGSVERG